MEHKLTRLDSMILMVLFFVLVLVASFAVPWKTISWGKVKLAPGDVVTVTGEAKMKQKNQKATFSAGVNAISDSKDTAISDVNKKIDAIIQAVKTFGVSTDDIKTQNLNVYQNEEQYYEDGRQKVRPGQWRVNNTVEITLRNVNQAQALADVLTKSGATTIYGPNFVLDDTGETETALLGEAIANAKTKALNIASSIKRTLGQVTSVTEGYSPMPVYRMEGGGGGGGAGIEPGTGMVTKTVTVTFELLP